MGSVRIGTASWTDKTLIQEGNFYPTDASSAEDRLRFYSSQFDIVEVDSTYYFPPTEKNAGLWVERTGDDFTFHIKSYSLLTHHPTRPDSIPADLRDLVSDDVRKKRFYYQHQLPEELIEEVWRRFKQALMPLHSSGKLGLIHMQFPQWFTPSRTSKDYILRCRDRLNEFGIAIELRNHAWMKDQAAQDRTFSFLEDHAIAYTSVDMPQGFASSIPPVARSTARISYVRFHGRNVDAWEGKHETATPRFAYLYTEGELAEWVPKIRELSEGSEEVHVLMNNCYQDYAVQNARQLAAMI